jgi:hypothetical protein
VQPLWDGVEQVLEKPLSSLKAYPLLTYPILSLTLMADVNPGSSQRLGFRWTCPTRRIASLEMMQVIVWEWLVLLDE